MTEETSREKETNETVNIRSNKRIKQRRKKSEYAIFMSSYMKKNIQKGVSKRQSQNVFAEGVKAYRAHKNKQN